MQFDKNKILQQQFADYNIKSADGDVKNYDMLKFQQSITKQNEEKLENFKQRLNEFKNAQTLYEAKELAKKIMPVKDGKTVFRIGEAKCIVINTDNLFRICLDTPQEFLSYDFV